MIIEYIRYRIASADAPVFEKNYAEAAQALHASPHCLAYELTRCVDELESYILRIEWDSAEGHMQGFRSSPDFSRFFQSVRPYVKAIEEMRHYRLTEVVAHKKVR